MSNKFSWKRVGMIFRLYSPGCKRQLALYAIITFALALLASIMSQIGMPINISISLPSMVITFMYIFAPLILLRRDYRSVSNGLPVKTSEKMFFLLAYFLVIIPVLINVTAIGTILLANIWMPAFIEGCGELFSMVSELFRWYMVYIQIVSNALFPMLCLLGILSSESNRLAKGVVYPVAYNVALSFISGVIAIVWSVKFFKSPQTQERLETIVDPIEVVSMMMPMINGLMIAIAIVSSALFVWSLCKIIKYTRQGGF